MYEDEVKHKAKCEQTILCYSDLSTSGEIKEDCSQRLIKLSRLLEKVEENNILLSAKACLHSMSPRRIKEASPVIVMKRSRIPRRPHLSTVAQSNSQAPPPAQTDSRYVQ